MKSLPVIIFFKYIYALSITNLLPSHRVCDLKLAFFDENQIIVLDLEPNSDSDLITCLLKDFNIGQSIYVLKGNNVSYETDFKKSHNVVILTDYIDSSIHEYDSIKFILKWHWSIVYIVITDKNLYRCENGTMNKNVLTHLEIFLNQFWHRFKIARVTVAFLQCGFIMYSGKLRNHQPLYDRTVKLIKATTVDELSKAVLESGAKLSEQYPLRANIFYRFPTSVTECTSLKYYAKDINLNRSDGYCGLDGLVMHDIVKFFKFKLFFPRDNDCQKYGYATSKQIAGSLGCIVRKELDMSFNSRFVRMYSNDHVNFLHFIAIDSLCALTTQRESIPLWHYAFDMFSIEQWAILIVLLIATGLVMWLTIKIKNRISGTKFMIGVWECIIISVKTTLFGLYETYRQLCRVLRANCLLCSIIFVAAYQSHVNHVFTTVSRYESIRTLKDMYKAGLTLYTSPTMKDMLNEIANPDNELEQRFIKTSHLLPGSRIGFILQHPNTVTLGRKIDTTLEIMLSYTDENGVPMINIVRECYGSYYLSYIARPGFPFVEPLQQFIERLRQTGLPRMYYMWTRRELGLPDSAILYQSEARPYTKISMSDQRIAFSILFVGYIISAVAFFVEIWRGKQSVIAPSS